MMTLLDILPDHEGYRIQVMAGDFVGKTGTIVRRTKTGNYLVKWDDTGLMGEVPMHDTDFIGTPGTILGRYAND